MVAAGEEAEEKVRTIDCDLAVQNPPRFLAALLDAFGPAASEAGRTAGRDSAVAAKRPKLSLPAQLALHPAVATAAAVDEQLVPGKQFSRACTTCVNHQQSHGRNGKWPGCSTCSYSTAIEEVSSSGDQVSLDAGSVTARVVWSFNVSACVDATPVLYVPDCDAAAGLRGQDRCS